MRHSTKEHPDFKIEFRLTRDEAEYLDQLSIEGGYPSRAMLVRSMIREIISGMTGWRKGAGDEQHFPRQEL